MLMRIALRMATIAVLKGKTLAGDNVLDSEITALDADADGVLRTDQQKPFVTVYTDASKVDAATGTRALYEGGAADLVIEIGIAATMIYRNEAGDKEVAAGIPATDDAFEFYLDVVGRQIVDALSDPSDPWAEVWRGLCHQVGKIERARTSSAEGTRLAAHQLKLTIDLWTDPVVGMEMKPEHPLARFFTLADAVTIANPAHDPEDESSPAVVPDPVMAAKVAMMRAQLSGSEDDLQIALRRYGMLLSEADAMLLTAPEGAGTEVGAVELNIAPVGRP